MTSVHLFIGAAIGKSAQNAIAAIPIAIISHYLLDTIPHYNPKPVRSYQERGLGGVNKKDLLLKGLEPLMGVILLCYLIYCSPGDRLAMATGAFFGWLPDFFVFLKWRFNINCLPLFIRKFETAYHRHIPAMVGTLPQVMLSLVAIFYMVT